MSPFRMSRLETAIRVVIEFNQCYNRHDLPAMLELVSPNCVYETSSPAPDGMLIKGREALASYWQDFFRASPQAHLQIEEVFGMGLRAIMRWKYTWLAEDGSQAHVRGLDLFRVEGGVISEILSYLKD